MDYQASKMTDRQIEGRQTDRWTDNASRDAGVLPCFTCTEDTTGRHLCLLNYKTINLTPSLPKQNNTKNIKQVWTNKCKQKQNMVNYSIKNKYTYK